MSELQVADLSKEDRDRISQRLGAPIHFPPEFKTWLLDYIAVNIPVLPISHFLGYVSTKAYSNLVETVENTDSGSYTDMATVGPQLSLPRGRYLLLYGATLAAVSSPGANAGKMSPSINGGAASDDDSVDVFTFNGTNMNGSFAIVKDLTTVETNTLVMRYKKDSGVSAGQPTWGMRWFSAIRFG